MGYLCIYLSALGVGLLRSDNAREVKIDVSNY